MTLFTLGAVTLMSSGELRVNGTLPPDYALDEAGARVGQGFVVDDRLRAKLALKGDVWELGTEWDLFSGQLAGDVWDIPGAVDARHREDLGVLDAGSFLPRQAYGQARLGPVQVQAGLVTSHWGLGMVANDGAHDPVFGRADFGDRVLRLRLATKPMGPDGALTVAVAADRVVADETATIEEGQVAWQGVFAALWAKDEDRAGAYAVVRDQTEADGTRRTQAGVLDLYGAVKRPATDAVFVTAAAEVAGITGTTSRSRTYNAAELAIQSAGATGSLGVGGERWDLQARGAWASGDGDPDDGVTHDFTFDRDHDVGMVLFDEVGGAVEAQTWTHLTDPEHAGYPPDGAEATVTEGSFRRATAVQPVATYRPTEWFTVRAGYLAAWSTAPIANPYTTFRNGGTPTNQLGVETSGRFLGHEVDGSVTVQAPAAWKLRPAAQVQGAYFVASPDLGGATGSYVLGTVRARW